MVKKTNTEYYHINDEYKFVYDIVNELDDIYEWVVENGFGLRGMDMPYCKQQELLRAADLLSEAQELLAKARRTKIKFECELFNERVMGGVLRQKLGTTLNLSAYPEFQHTIRVLNGWATDEEFKLAAEEIKRGE